MGVSLALLLVCAVLLVVQEMGYIVSTQTMHAIVTSVVTIALIKHFHDFISVDIRWITVHSACRHMRMLRKVCAISMFSDSPVNVSIALQIWVRKATHDAGPLGSPPFVVL